jgi:hypothetical protein
MTIKTVSMIAILTVAFSSPVFARHQHHVRWPAYQKPQQRVMEYPNEPGVSPRSLRRTRGPVNLGGGCAL